MPNDLDTGTPAITFDTDDLQGASRELEVFDDPEKEYLIFRVRPKLWEGSGDSYLCKYQQEFSFEEVKARFGGGTFRVRPRKAGKWAKPSWTFAIDAQPKYDNGSGDNHAAGVASSEMSGETTLATLILNEMSALRRELVTFLRDGGDGTGAFKKKLQIALDAKLINQVIDSASGAQNQIDPMKWANLVLDSMQAGAEMTPAEHDTGSMIATRLFSLLDRVNPSSPTSAVSKDPLGGMMHHTAPDEGRVPSNLESAVPTGAVNRADVAEPSGSGTLESRVMEAIGVCLHAITSEGKDYDSEELATFALHYLTPDDCSALRGHLEFDNLRGICANDPLLLVDVDENRKAIEGMLAVVRQRLDTGSRPSPDNPE
jgi:hypothetical protein